MTDFAIHFTYPWLLLLLIPAAALALIPYFRLSKKYRRTRNRVTSLVLGLVAMTLAILMLAGLEFTYRTPNEGNELILLVDVSDTEEQAAEKRDQFIQTVLKQSRDCKVGVVTFGFDQRYAVPITTDVGSVYSRYIKAEMPDISATNIAGALNYAKTLFQKPATSKVVLITDGKETDGAAISVIRSLVAQGTKVDTVNISSSYGETDVQVTDAVFMDSHISVDDECTLNVTLKSKGNAVASVEITDNGESIGDSQTVQITEGAFEFPFKHTFRTKGLHEISVSITSNGDVVDQNNNYVTYVYLEDFNKVLLLESFTGDSDSLAGLLTSEELMPFGRTFEVTVENIASSDLPTSVEGLLEYDQIILNNIAQEDMPAGFEKMLESYVKEYGGGLLTLGGTDTSGKVHSYNVNDMYNTLYQKMLPVDVIDYTPPVGVMVIVDVSGSMSSTINDATKLDWARAGAKTCYDALTERDYFGLMTLSQDYNTILGMTPCTEKDRIVDAINTLTKTESATIFPAAIERAGMALRPLEVAKKHIIIVTDGEVPSNQAAEYESKIAEYHETDNISVSVVAIGMSETGSSADLMRRAVQIGEGKLYYVDENAINTLPRIMSEDIAVPKIAGKSDGNFSPIVKNPLSSVLNGVARGEELKDRNKLTVTLGGYYGSKVKSSADLILCGDFNVPVYAKWQYGNGNVGSFMCDLNGTDGSFSQLLMMNPNGIRLIYNIINNLMPMETIRTSELRVDIANDNYTNKLSVYTIIHEGETVAGQMEKVEAEGDGAKISLNSAQNDDENFYVVDALGAESRYSRCNFVVKESGLYKITVTKYDAENKVIAETVTYKTFSYSEEYDVYLQQEEELFDEFLAELAYRGNGIKVEDLDNPYDIFDTFVRSTTGSYDPRVLLAILSIVLLLLDVFVRKFKFKWLHEIFREWKSKRQSSK